MFDLDEILAVLGLDDDGPVVTLDDVLDVIEAELEAVAPGSGPDVSADTLCRPWAEA